jgi:hypothetical protein
MNPTQLSNLRALLTNMLAQQAQSLELHHGDCLGADAQAHALATELGVRTVIHPPKNTSKRAFVCGDEYRLPLHYIARNHRIVDQTEILIAAPKGAKEEVRSGTWATVRYAALLDRPLLILTPGGGILRSRPIPEAEEERTR